MPQSFPSLLRENKAQGKKTFALLVDPDEYREDALREVLTLASETGVDYIFVGGSLVVKNRLEQTIALVKSATNLPAVLFPGSSLQFCPSADAILFLTLISGRNPDLLIGRHVEVAPSLRSSNVDVVPTGYMIIDGGRPTSVSYISNTQPIPHDKCSIAQSTAIAGELLGLNALYMDAGSGARQPVPARMIRAVRKAVDLPLIVGGGIRTPDAVSEAARSGADVVVAGNALEEEMTSLPGLVKALRTASIPAAE